MTDVSLRRPPHQLVVTVLGSGTMGAQIAAHFANAGIRAHLLDIVPADTPADAPAARRNALAIAAVKSLAKSRPPALMTKAFASRIQVGNIDDDLEEAVAHSDIILEAVVERLDVKQALLSRVAAAAKNSAILATNTSGIPISAIAEGLPAAARPRLVGMHFFNPPRFMHLLELIPGQATDADLVADLANFSDRVLGKGVVLCRDTPNFIGNRIGIAEMLLTFAATDEGDYTIEEVDFLNGKLVGRPKTGSYRLGDMVGLDIVGHVVRNLSESLSGDPDDANYDPLYAMMKLPKVLESMLSSHRLGDKTQGGFYKKTRDAQGKRSVLSLDLKSLDYRPKQKPRFEELKQIRRTPVLEVRIKAALASDGRAGDFLRKVYINLFNYCATLSGTICDTPQQIDDAMRWGFGWELGPFAMMDAVGLRWCATTMAQMNIKPASALVDLLESEGDEATWYRNHNGKNQTHTRGSYTDVTRPEGMIFLAPLKGTHEIAKNSTAALLDLGDGVACVEFRSKANIIDEGVVDMLAKAPTLLAERGFKGFVIGNQGPDFCLGANLLQIVMWSAQKKWDDLEQAVATLQNTFMGLRHCPMPVVAAPHGRTLGGGVECSLHADEIQAGADLFMGLVEVAVGVLPAGGGLKEIVRRGSAWSAQLPGTDPYEWIRRGFEAAATAKVSMSAFEARESGWLTPQDGISFHKSRVIADAKSRVIALHAGGYVPPDPSEAIAVIGEPRGASFELGAQMFAWGGYASEHDQLIGKKIAHVLSGGMSPTAGTATAQELLDLEREAFISLCGTQKTLARLQHMLETNKPLRN